MDIIYIGDIHGNFGFIKWFVKAHQITNAAIVQVGDFGIGFEPTNEYGELKRLNDVLLKNGVFLYVVRGNHDNPNYFNGSFNDFENINLMPDYSVMKIGEKNHLFVGGAISIDRKIRVNKVSYWEDEVFVLDEDRLRNLTGIEVLVTHNSMSFLPPMSVNGIVLEFASVDNTLLSELADERAAMTRMWDILTNENGNKIELHVYGHFHFDSTTFIDDTKHVLLGIEKTLYVQNQNN